MPKIELNTNKNFNDIEVKKGIDQYSCHSHVHKSWSISYVLEGKTIVNMGTWKSELVKNQFIAIPPGIPHLCSPIKDCEFKFSVLNIPFEYLSYLKFYFSNPRVGKFDYLSYSKIEEKFLTTNILDELILNINELSIFLKGNSHEIEEFKGDNLLESIQNKYLKELETNRYKKYRFYIKKYGIGFKKITTILKMEYAKQILNTNSDISQIALECGFYDQSHFSKVFKSYTGMNPYFYIKSKNAQIYNK